VTHDHGVLSPNHVLGNDIELADFVTGSVSGHISRDIKTSVVVADGDGDDRYMVTFCHFLKFISSFQQISGGESFFEPRRHAEISVVYFNGAIAALSKIIRCGGKIPASCKVSRVQTQPIVAFYVRYYEYILSESGFVRERISVII
jgi:hypothetical protein